jgi:hypothetical protein
VTNAGGATRRPFTVVCCEHCGDPALSVLHALGESIRRCRHGMLVRAGCLRGPLYCAVHGHGPGVMIVLQPCSEDRRPSGSADWVGPIKDEDDLRIVRDWVEQGAWDRHALPDRLRAASPRSEALDRRN